MDAKALLDEYLSTKEEYAKALAEAQKCSEALAVARAEYTDARATEMKFEKEIERAAAQLTMQFQQLHMTKEDLPSISDFLVEYHANIGCYHCYLFVEGDQYDGIDISKLQLKVAFPMVELRVNGDEEKCLWMTEIERNVDTSKCVIERKIDHLYIRLPLNESDKAPLGGVTSLSQVEASELVAENYGSIACRLCNNQLLKDKNVIAKVLPLPSANWMDMFDFWGAGIGAFEHIPREDIFAQPTRLYVGESHVLLHADDIAPSATVTKDQDINDITIERPDENQEKANHSVTCPVLHCSTCLTILGSRHPENNCTIRLDKHLISSSQKQDGAHSEEDIFARYTVDSIISATLLELVDSDGVFRYSLKLPSSSSTNMAVDQPLSATSISSLQLQLLSWETMVQSKRSGKFQRVLKVLYGTCLNNASTPTKTTPGLPLPSHDLDFPPAVSKAIVERLNKSSLLLPPSLRHFNKMNVGYLFA